MRQPLTIALAALLLAACHGRAPANDAATASAGDSAPQQPLPHPQPDGQPVTGMPAARAQPAAVAPETTAPAPTPDTRATDGAAAEGSAQDAPAAADAAPEPTIDDGMRVIRDYYDAINRGAYERAYALWSGRGAASGKTLQQFRDGYADTAHDDVDMERPSAVDAAAGSRYLEVPVRVTATGRDQSSTTYIGSYVLRRSVVDGASAEQRQWRIQSARLRQDD